MTTSSKQTFLVLGSTGKTGSRVAARLAARGLEVRGASRSSVPAFDWREPASWADVLRGVTAVYVTYYPDLALPNAPDDLARLMACARQHGVRRVVLLSGRGERGAVASEQPVRDSGLPYTVLRASWFAQNFSEGHLLDSVHAGEIAFPAGSVAEPFIDAEDIAEVAVAALTERGHDGQTYELTGPRLLTFAEAAEELSEALGRSIRYTPVSFAEYAEALVPFLPAEHIDFLIKLFAEVLDGHNAFLTDGVERVLGRAPRDFRGFARATAATGAWSSAPASE